jgi:hypothetical protein
LVDLAPTILSLAGQLVPSDYVGRDLSSPAPMGRELYAAGILYGQEQVASIRGGVLTVWSSGMSDGKWTLPGGQSYSEALTAVVLRKSATPDGDRHVVTAAPDPETGERIKKRWASAQVSNRLTLDESALRDLRSLGYAQ